MQFYIKNIGIAIQSNVIISVFRILNWLSQEYEHKENGDREICW